MASFSKGNGYSKADLIEEGHPLILYGRLYTKYETIIESVDTFAKLQDKSILSKGGEVIVPSSGESAEDISRASVVDVAGVVLGGDLNIIKTNSELNPTFLALTISNGSQQKEMSKRAQGKSIVHLHNSDLKEINLLYPKIEEQIYIGLFFKKLEDTINLHQRKLEQLKELKKAYLQVMFPEKDERVPKLRFADFEEEWELCKLGKLAEFNPKSNLPEKFEYVDLESVVGTELVGHRLENRDSAPSRAQRLAKKNDVFYQTVRPYQKNNYLFDLPYDNYVFSTGYAQMRPSGNGYFLLTLVQEEKFVNRVLERSTGTSYPAISSNDLAKLSVRVPADIEEEQNIGKFFSNLDNLVTLHQNKLTQLKSLKKSYLQNMFI
ncbi:restriction endonuclease subunit S [Enterococcus faecalis]|uniref:restriction endonuclease subunit S n=1 Tax=Enterococcus faecalis TaxID=1351 RepID=UPI0035D7F822